MRFLRNPYTEESCAGVEGRFPALGSRYRALAALRPQWEASEIVSLRETPTTAFQFALIWPGTEEACTQLLAAQVGLFEEDLRDHLERLHGASAEVRLASSGAGATSLALQCLAFHEATFLTLIGTLEARADDSGVEFHWTKDGAESLWDRVRSTTTQNFTDLATEKLLGEIRHEAEARRSADSASVPISHLLFPQDLDRAARRLLDSCFAISERMQLDPEIRPLIEDSRQLCRWIALMAIARQSKDHVVAPGPELLERLALDAEMPGRVIEGLAGKLRSDQGFYRTARGEFCLGTLSVGYSINCCKRLALPDDVAIRLGEHFESHVKSYISEGVPTGDYVTLDGIRPDGKHQGASYDCDLILYEPKRRKVFFIQAKWKRESRTANLEDEMKLWRQKNFALGKGVNQMKGLRDRLSEPAILDKVKTRLHGLGLSDHEIIENASFIVVHTLPFFSAHEDDGIAVYEWNLFRNAIQRGVVQRTRLTGPGQRVVEFRQHSGILEIEDPRSVMDHFAAAVGSDAAEQEFLRAARTDARYQFTVGLQPTRFWHKWFGAPRLTVTRPYT
jgi:hypothetical protein